MLLQQTFATTTALVHYLVSTYYAHLASVLIVYDGNALVQQPQSSSSSFSSSSQLQQLYLDAVEQAFRNQSLQGKIIGLQWINVGYFKDVHQPQGEYEEQMLEAVNIVVEGFITILQNTSKFLHARYYATRHATPRLKDKVYLFLCEDESPEDLLASEILQFYPHHLMVSPQPAPPERFDFDSDTVNNNCSQRCAIKNAPQANTANPTSFSQEAPKNFILPWTENVATWTPATSCNAGNEDRDINFELWTQKYVGGEDNLNATHLDTYVGRSRQFARNAQLYPDKLWNLQRRTMRIGTLTYVPYVKTNYVSPGEGDADGVDSNGPNKTVRFVGGEAELMKTFCQTRNCHLRIQPYAADDWGEIYENGSSNGMLGDMYQQETEMAIGCVYNWYNDIMEVSQFIARSAVTILGPGPAQFPRWRTNIMPFCTELWIFLFITLIMCSIMFHFIKYSAHQFKHAHSARPNKYGTLEKYQKTLLDIFAVFIQQPSADTVLHRFASRVFLAFLLCATITLENTYSGQLKSILTRPLFTEPVDTMDKWSLTGWKWGAPSIIWVSTIEGSDIKKEQLLVDGFEVRDYEFLFNASFRNDYGLAVERILSGSFSFGPYVTVPALENKIVPKDDLYFDWTRAVAIRGWPLMPLLDRHIMFCLETGLFVHWEKQFTYRALDHQVQDILQQLATDYHPKLPPQTLTIENISGPLFLLLFGYVAALIAFLGEIFVHRMKQTAIAVGEYEVDDPK